MKPTITLSALLLVLAMTFSMPTANAHNFHRHHPAWVDVHHCRVETRHLYFPAYNIYYDMERSLFIYLSGDTWMFSLALPAMYSHIDLAYEPIVELDFYYDRPFIYNEYHIVHYRDYHRHYGRHDYREYGHHHEYYSYTPKHHYKYHDYDGPRNYGGRNSMNSGRHDNGNHYGHYKNGKANGYENNSSKYGRKNEGQRNDHYGNGRNYGGSNKNSGNNKGVGNNYKKSNTDTRKVYEGHRGSSNGNGRSSNSRSSNARSGGYRM